MSLIRFCPASVSVHVRNRYLKCHAILLVTATQVTPVKETKVRVPCEIRLKKKFHSDDVALERSVYFLCLAFKARGNQCN